MALSTLVSPVSIAVMLDPRGFPWARDILEFTARMINNKTDGWFDDLLPHAQLELSFSDTACDADVAVRAYLDLIKRQEEMPHAIAGCRCSGPTMDVARLVAAENGIMVSPTASSPKLSNKENYPTFSRLVGPDSADGQVGALIELIKSFGWERISVLYTEKDYTRDLYAELTRQWDGEIKFTAPIQITNTDSDTDEVDPVSVQNVLRSIPVKDPSRNSRIIVLLAHHQHAYPILQTAAEMGIQDDSVWIGSDAWTSYHPEEDVDIDSWMPPIPGYIGLTPVRNRTSDAYQDFLARLQQHQQETNQPVMTDLPDSADRTVDSILALVGAFTKVPRDQRRNGTLVTAALRDEVLEGVSGPVRFNDKGDAANPSYAVMALPKAGEDWICVGVASPTSVSVDLDDICFAGKDYCDNTIPLDRYPMPSNPLGRWMIALLALMSVTAVVLAVVMYLLRRKWRKSTTLSERLKLLQEEIGDVDAQDSSVRRRKGRLYKEFARLLGEPAPWEDGTPGLIKVEATASEYWDVCEKLKETMDEECHISSLQRVQNDAIWSYFVFRKNQMANKYGTHLNDDKTLKELSVWHGTSSMNPDVIHGSHNQNGFMMQYSLQGLYGRGIYFSERSGYSDCYSYRVNSVGRQSDAGYQGDREMFLVKLLVGRSKELNHNESDMSREYCHELVIPPEAADDDQPRFDSVTGESDCGTKIHVVYDNGRAYPQYLVRYYKGPRDEARTPFEGRKEAMKLKRRRSSRIKFSFSEATERTTVMDDSDVELGVPVAVEDPAAASLADTVAGPPASPPPEEEEVTWEFEDGNGVWSAFSEEMTVAVEQVHTTNPAAKFPVQTDLWMYEIDLANSTQTNVQHPDHTQRKIRRRSST